MGLDASHSLERICLTLSETSPLPAGWAFLRPGVKEQSILLAHLVLDQKLNVTCDRTILLEPMSSSSSSQLVSVTFSGSDPDSTNTNSTSLLIRDLTDVANLLKGDDMSISLPKKVAKKSTGGSPAVKGSSDLDCFVRVEDLKREKDDDDDDDPPLERPQPSPSPEQDSALSVSIEPFSFASSVEPVNLPGSPFAARSSSFAPNSPSSRRGTPPPVKNPNSSLLPTGLVNADSADVNAFLALKKKTPTTSTPFNFRGDKERPFKCPECGKSFLRGNHLKDHMRLHAGETYECPVCQYQCILQTKFTHHLTSHNGQAPFECAQCGKLFDRAHDLARHLPLDHKLDTGFKLSHFENSFSAAAHKDKTERAQILPRPPTTNSASSRNPLNPFGAKPALKQASPFRPKYPFKTAPFSKGPLARPFGPGPVSNPRPFIPSISSVSAQAVDFGDGSFEDMQRLMRLYSDDQPTTEVLDDDSVIPIDDVDDHEDFPRVKSLDDEFNDDAILVE